MATRQTDSRCGWHSDCHSDNPIAKTNNHLFATLLCIGGLNKTVLGHSGAGRSRRQIIELIVKNQLSGTLRMNSLIIFVISAADAPIMLSEKISLNFFLPPIETGTESSALSPL